MLRIKAHKINLGKELDVCLTLAIALSTIQMTVRFSSNPPQFRGNTPWKGQEPPTSLSFQPTSREDLLLDGYLQYPQAAKAIYIYKHPCLLRDSPRPKGTALSFVNFYTGRVT
ncbi:hypothetical protein TNCV_2681951 [Trichonephila clavipes]|nr:hypothetical protein TNCV_2681951 [Trichonephila clavipes]